MSTLAAVALYGKVTAYGNRFREEDMDRRHFLQSSIALSTLAGAPGVLSSQNWKAGPLAHLIPSASHSRISVKATFSGQISDAVLLTAIKLMDARLTAEAMDLLSTLKD